MSFDTGHELGQYCCGRLYRAREHMNYCYKCG